MVDRRLRRIAIIVSVLAAALVVVGFMPGLLVMQRDCAFLESGCARALWTERAGGWLELVAAASIVAAAIGLYRAPSHARGWAFVAWSGLVVVALCLIGYVITPHRETSYLPAGRVFLGLERAQLAMLFVVLPLVLLLGKGAPELPRARLRTGGSHER